MSLSFEMSGFPGFSENCPLSVDVRGEDNFRPGFVMKKPVFRGERRVLQGDGSESLVPEEFETPSKSDLWVTSRIRFEGLPL